MAARVGATYLRTHGRRAVDGLPLRPVSRLLSLLATVVRAVPTIVGAPDYERYVAFVRTQDPTRPVPDRATFERERLTARYARPGSRCC